MSAYLSRLYAGAPFQDLKAAAKGAVNLLPEPFQEGARRAKELLKAATVGGTLFEELGFRLHRPHRRPRHGAASGRPAHGEGTRGRAGPDPR
jgi:deoxyxylulose-5-phosphate synthase